MDVELSCLLCGSENESKDHLFFECPYSKEVWSSITTTLMFPSPPVKWTDIMAWLHSSPSGSTTALALLQAWQGCISELWNERNRRVHQGFTLPVSLLITKIISSMKNKCTAMSQIGSAHGDALLEIWSPS
ncbi:uncharacterized protein LOC112089261 [Eutrema salsugineum]|uniref:uncharacterized protein LOC112089261 n=1 Tax=Eutrema salsugineum TaxID=72664 RepID=UPI000CED1236|nr:uncharacterized protein LOC112089261 [Eutrema salsugineum]